MNPEEIQRTIDAYEDGSLSREDASRLAALIRGGGERSEYIMAELELRGFISQAMDTTDGDSMLRSFMERLKAEDESATFVKQFSELSQTIELRHAEREISLLTDLAPKLNSREDEAYDEPPAVTRVAKIWRTFAIVACLLVLLLALVLWPSVKAPVSPLKISLASASVVIWRDSQSFSGPEIHHLLKGDRLRVPEGDRLLLDLESGVELEVTGAAELEVTRLELGKCSLRLLKGEVMMNRSSVDASDCVLESLHVELHPHVGRYSFSCTMDASRISVLEGSADIEDREGRKKLLHKDEQWLVGRTGFRDQ